MRRSLFSFLEMFQDPVFTILALILLSTTPMIFPGEGKKIDPQVPQLAEEIKALDKAIKELKEKQTQLEEEKEKKAGEYESLMRDLKDIEDKKLEAKEKEQQQRKMLEDLQKALEARKREVEKLQAEVQRFGSRLGGPKPEGFYALGTSSKSDFYIQLTGNRLYPVDEAHFSARDALATVRGGEIVAVTVKTRRKGADGDRLEDLEQPNSNLEQVLKNLNASQKRIIFLVASDSFPIFRQARGMVLKRGFECGWIFTNRQEIILGAARPDERVRSTTPP